MSANDKTFRNSSKDGSKDASLEDYYAFVQEKGKLRTKDHARRWSTGVLKTLGTAIGGKKKRELAKVLPEELSEALRGVFWLLHFRNPNLSSSEFAQRVARRSGNSNAEFALYPIMAVFGGIQRFYSNTDINKSISDALSPELRELWQKSAVETVR